MRGIFNIVGTHARGAPSRPTPGNARAVGVAAGVALAVAVAIVVTMPGCAQSQFAASPKRAPASNPAVEAMVRMHAVAVSPRCINCHSPTDRPFQLDTALQRVHTMDIQRKFNQLGGSCQTCHQSHNLDGDPHLPPGADGWTMPLKEADGTVPKGYEASITAHELCQHWQEAKYNFFESGPNFHKMRSPADMITHAMTDALVLWAFNPGGDRTTPPYSRDTFQNDMKTWVNGGMPCPD